MTYKNYLTTPAGRYYELTEISNGDYLILIKYLQGENYQMFFQCLTEIVSRDIKDFDDLDFIEKCYVFLAYCMYSIRGNIVVNNPMIGDQDISISLILNNIEMGYIQNHVVDYKLSQNFVLQFGYPKSFFFDNGSPVIDFYSGLIGFNGVELSEAEKVKLKETLGTKQLSFIDDYLREQFKNTCDIFHGVPMNQMVVNLINEGMIGNVIGFYKMPLDGFYHIMYAMIKHLRMSYSDFMKISQIETNIMLGFAAEENKKMDEQSKSGDIGSIGRALSNAD